MKRLFTLLTLAILSVPLAASAATFNVFVDAGSNSINALEATMRLPIMASDIHTGGSTILFWINSPAASEGSSTIAFSGLSPGGFQGKRFLFSFSADMNNAQIAETKFFDIRALLNDGKGTPAAVRFSIAKGEAIEDNIPPENFAPVVSKQGDLFEGKYFVSFVSQDKGAGIDHYEYATTNFLSPASSDWKKAESPLSLTSSEARKRIFIKAVDSSGNERTENIFGPNYYRVFFLWAIIIGLAIWALSYIKRFVR